jgi:3-phytase
MKKLFGSFASAFIVLISGCSGSKLPVISAKVVTGKSVHDTDDPAIWVNAENPEESLVFGTDKETDGAIFAYDLDGNILEKYTLRGIQRPNNVDVEYGLRLNDSVQTDILVFTERERQQIRVFSVPGMQPLDGGGFPVFEDEANPEFRLPMGVAVYKSPENGDISVVVGRKTGPRQGYLHQYALRASDGVLRTELLRKFGNFSGQKEIEAIAVDDALGYVYYSDEGVCIRKYHAEPEKGDLEITCFGGEYFKEDIEGIALAAYPDGSGYLLVSNQQAGEFNVFDRRTNEFLRAVNLGTVETDGCEAVTAPLGNKFPNGLFVAMNDDRTFHFYDLKNVLE